MKPEHETAFRQRIDSFTLARSVLQDAWRVTRDDRLFIAIGHLANETKQLQANLDSQLGPRTAPNEVAA